MPAQFKNIARVVRTHGSKGEVLVAPLRGLPFLLHEGMSVSLTPPALKRPRWVTVESLRAENEEGALVRFSCSHDLHGSESILCCTVLAHAEDITLGPLTAAYDDLIGRTVIDERYGELGQIREVMETPANDVWVVNGTAHGEVLIPVIPDAVESIPGEGPIAVHIMDGLLNE